MTEDIFSETICPLKAAQNFRSLESLLPPSSNPLFQLGDLVPLVKAVGSHFIPLRRSPFEDMLVTRESANG